MAPFFDRCRSYTVRLRHLNDLKCRLYMTLHMANVQLSLNRVRSEFLTLICGRLQLSGLNWHLRLVAHGNRSEQVQLNSGDIQRDYLALCHGWMPSLEEIAAAVQVIEDSARILWMLWVDLGSLGYQRDPKGYLG